MRRVLVPLDLQPVAQPAPGDVVNLAGEAMGTTWSVRLAPPLPRSSAALINGIRSRVDRVIAEMSPWEAQSDLCRFNRAPAGTWVDLPRDFLTVLDLALNVARLLEGAFDPTVGPLVEAWGFGPAPCRGRPPDEEALEAARRRTGWRRIAVDRENGRGFQPGDVALDFCGIAKGYAVDLVADYLLEAGVESHLIEIGGELRGLGVKPDGQPWWVTLERPPEHGHSLPTMIDTVVALHGMAVATSGDYRRYFEHDGVRYSHTIDAGSGRPVSGPVSAVTVLHRSCAMADALATGLGVLGPERGLDMARRHDIAARFLLRSETGFAEQMSPAFAAMLD